MWLHTGLLPGCSNDGPGPEDTPVDTDEALDALLQVAEKLRGINYIGPHCAKLPEWANQEDLANLLLTRIRQYPGSLADAIGASISSDFRDRHLIDIEHWRLSQTECLLAALAAVRQNLSEPAPYPVGKIEGSVFCEVSRWGPQSMAAGTVFNEQPDGEAAFWVRMGCAPDTAQLFLGSTPLRTNVRPQVVVARVPHAAELERGVHQLKIVDHATQESMLIGDFIVE